MNEDKNRHGVDGDTPKVGRRHFLKGAAGGAAALAVVPAGKAQDPSAFTASYSAPTYQQIQRDTGMLT
ncbi:MAG TPA: twin-arginine translocation signal domain-containing protein, partial [Hyphomicrobiales bacterium]|nr:twin-arginine translocation signal domain-containing protein [Hyphomicrobiales bacterium]